MSRIGKKPIAVPTSVSVTNDPSKNRIGIEGPKGKLDFEYRPEVEVNWDEAGKQIFCTLPEKAERIGQMRAWWGTTRAHIQNMVTGVTEGFSRKLEVVGVGWGAKMNGKKIELNIGYCDPVGKRDRDFPNGNPPPGIEVVVDGQFITVSGIDRQAVGQFAAEIREKRKPEPYKGKGIRYTNEHVIRKVGKQFGA